MQSGHGQSGVLAVELDRYESGEALERLVDQEKLGLDALELVGVLPDLLLHDFGRVGRTNEVVLRRLCIVQLHPQIELVVYELVSLEGAIRVLPIAFMQRRILRVLEGVPTERSARHAVAHLHAAFGGEETARGF